MTFITEIDLVNKICEFIDYVPDRSEWNEFALESNPPRLIRLQQVNALMKAYLGEEMTIQDFIEGNFIKKRSIDEYNAISLLVKNHNNTNKLFYDTMKKVHIRDVKMLFTSLIDYRLKINSAIYHNSGWLVASGNLLEYSIFVTGQINKLILNSLGELNHALSLIINPTSMKFTKSALIEKFGYPSEDLDEIDLNWL